jgi:putative redox protein
MEIKVTHLDNVRFQIQAREHSIVSDQPVTNGGEDTGMTPPELMLASLGSCAAFYAVQYLKTRNLLGEKPVEVTVNAEKLLKPARLGNFTIRVDCPVPLTPEQNEGLIRSVHHCLVHNTLLTPPSVEIELYHPDLALLHS